MSGEKRCPVCPIPFSSPSILPGGFKVCCMPQMKLHKDISFWNGDEVRQMRRALLAGGVPDECRSCVKAMSVMSTAKMHVPNAVYEEYVPLNFKYVSLARNNTCNLACKMCSRELSTGYGRRNGGIIRLENSINLSLYYDEIEELYISGGNPVQDLKLLEMLETMPTDRIQYVMFTSNGTSFPLRFLNALKRFKRVSICFSIDGSRETNEIFRVGVNHQRFYCTLKRIVDYTAKDENISICIQQTLNSECVLSSFELYEELCRNINIGQVTYAPNVCHSPHQYSVFNLPESATDELIAIGKKLDAKGTAFAFDMRDTMFRLAKLNSLVHGQRPKTYEEKIDYVLRIR